MRIELNVNNAIYPSSFIQHFTGMAGIDKFKVQGETAGNIHKSHKTGLIPANHYRSFSEICNMADQVLFANIQGIELNEFLY